MAPTRRELESMLRGILAELFPDHDIAVLRDDDDLAETLGIDSMAQFDVVLEIERRLGCHIPDEDLQRLTTIRTTVEYLEAALQAV